MSLLILLHQAPGSLQVIWEQVDGSVDESGATDLNN